MRIILGLVLFVIAFKILKKIGKFAFWCGFLVGAWMLIEGLFGISLIAMILSW